MIISKAVAIVALNEILFLAFPYSALKRLDNIRALSVKHILENDLLQRGQKMNFMRENIFHKNR